MALLSKKSACKTKTLSSLRTKVLACHNTVPKPTAETLCHNQLVKNSTGCVKPSTKPFGRLAWATNAFGTALDPVTKAVASLVGAVTGTLAQPAGRLRSARHCAL